MANIYLKLLKEFEATGLSSKKSLSPFMERHFKKPTSVDFDEWNKQNEPSSMFLQDVRHTGHFDFDNSEELHIGFNYILKKGRWYDNVNINARINILGLEYLEKQKSNDIVKRNSNLQTIAIYLTVLFTLITLIVSINAANSSDLKDKQQILLQEQSKQIHTLQIALSEAKNLQVHPIVAKKTSPKN
jgi:hypothetical protein